MEHEQAFQLVGLRPGQKENRVLYKHRRKDIPWVSLGILGVLLLGCLFAEVVMPKDPGYLDLENFGRAPSREFWFGTDTLGRDIFSCIWYGGRISIFIGFLAALIATVIGVVYGTVSGVAPRWLDNVLMRLLEIILSIPGLLLILFVQAIFGKPNVVSVSVAVGITSWCAIAKVVRTEVQQLRSAEYIMAAKCMGGGFFYILRKHLAPNFISSVMFIVVMNIRTAIGVEATLSFLGMGLPIEIVTWGSMLSLAEKALMSRAWWMILIPGAFLVTLMMCITNVGNFLRKQANKKESSLL